jgi:hypothetical protein
MEVADAPVVETKDEAKTDRKEDRKEDAKDKKEEKKEEKKDVIMPINGTYVFSVHQGFARLCSGVSAVCLAHSNLTDPCCFCPAEASLRSLFGAILSCSACEKVPPPMPALLQLLLFQEGLR